jgi:hypothetical protein
VDRPFLTDSMEDASIALSSGGWSGSKKLPGGKIWDVGPTAFIVAGKILAALEHLHSNNVVSTKSNGALYFIYK